jgi:hypothetical protein
MDPTRERRLNETPTAPTKKLSTSLLAAERFDSRRVRAHRAIVRELDEFLGIFTRPDVNVIYAVAPAREPEGGSCP